MAGKIVIMKNSEFQAQSSAEKLESELASLRAQLSEVTGVRQNEDGTEFPASDFIVDPETKRNIVDHLNFIRTTFQANKKLSNTGREPKADLTSLQRVYVDYIRGHRTQNRELAAMSVAVQYNDGRSEDQHITGSYVVRAAKKNNWDALIDAPEPVMA